MALPFLSIAQIQTKNVNTMHLKVEDGLAMSRADDIVCDNQNILWIKSNRGLQYWDGQSIYTFQDSLLDVGTGFHIYKHNKDGIIVSTAGLVSQFTFEGLRKKTIYRSNITETDFIPIVLPTKNSLAILVHPDSIFLNDFKNPSKIEFIAKQTSHTISNTHQFTFRGIKYIADFRSNKCLINTTASIDQIIEPLYNNYLRNAILFDSKEFITTLKDGLHIFNNTVETIYPYPDMLEANFYSSILKTEDGKLLIGIDNMLYEFDNTAKKWISIYKNIDQNNLIQTGYFDKLIYDQYNNIWAITVNEGLLKIYNNDNFKYYGTGEVKLNFVKNIVVDEDANRIITAALNGGIIIYDTLGNISHHLISDNTKGLVKSVTGIYKISENKYIYNNHNDSIIYGLSIQNEMVDIQLLPSKKESYVYYQDALRIDSTTSFLLFNTLYKLQHSPFELTPLFLYSSTKSCMIKDGNELWIGCIDGLIKYEIGDGDNYQFISLPGEGYIRSISKWKNDLLALGTDNGLSIFNKKKSKLTNIDEGCIYCLLTDDQDNIWAGTGAGIIRYDQDFKMTRYSKINGLQNNEFNTNACVKSNSGKMYFGGLNGITSFNPNFVTNKENNTSFFIKNLTANNTNLVTNEKIEDIKEYSLNYDQTNLNLTVGTIGKFESSVYNYQYFVDGLSSEWTDAEHQTKYNFNLSPGRYKFYFSASNAFDPTAELKNPLYIIIKSPWWQQWWFYLLSIFSIIGIITYVIKANEKQKYLKKKFEWELAYQRQEDRINMSKELHDNIGSRLTFLVSSIENIKKAFQFNNTSVDKKIDQLADFGKATIEDLRSMMWVLTQESITIQDLQLKILDFLNIAKNSYREIDFQFDGPENGLEHKLDSKMSQNIFRVIQEAIHNCVKHANPSLIKIQMSFDHQKLKICIEDDGLGFDSTKVTLGNGLHNIKSRLLEHQSDLHINSNYEKGTMLNFEVLVL